MIQLVTPINCVEAMVVTKIFSTSHANNWGRARGLLSLCTEYQNIGFGSTKWRSAPKDRTFVAMFAVVGLSAYVCLTDIINDKLITFTSILCGKLFIFSNWNFREFLVGGGIFQFQNGNSRWPYFKERASIWTNNMTYLTCNIIYY